MQYRSRRKTLLPLFRFPCYSYIIYSKDKNLCISQTIRSFCVLWHRKQALFFNEISDLFGIKMGFAKVGLSG
ncbi:MAG: hypothetical protein DRG39_05140 [Deltaproteobacteria bacterium]|nr:MAG: hypothetical protein DRG39_05140 [Deltaproteobacteria bacterium]